MPTAIGLDDLDFALTLAGGAGWRPRRNGQTSRAADAERPLASTGGLVARDRELAYLNRALLAARRGVSDVMLLRGEPGMGKSSLIQVAIAQAHEVRQVVLQGTLYSEGTVPTGGWPQPIVDLVRRFSSPDPDISDGPVIDATLQALRNVAGHGLTPLLLSVDDCHLLPSDFLAALVDATRSQPLSPPIVLVLASSATLSMSSAHEDDLAASTFDLLGLNLPQAQVLLKHRCDRMPPPRILLELIQATGGNPEALIDACNGLTTEELNGLCPLPDPLPLSKSLVGKFSFMFHALPEETRDALCIAATGRIPLGSLKLAMADLGMSELTLKPAQHAGVLVVSRHRTEFANAIERSAVYWLSSEEARSRAHQAVSRAFLQQGHVELGAHHATRYMVKNDDNLARLHLHAAQVALDRGNAEAAAGHHKVASDCAESKEATAHHLVIAASLLVTIGQIDRALAYLDQASQLDPSDHLRGEAMYLEARARLASDLDSAIAHEMITAADLCEGDATDWAVLMLVDAATCLLSTGSADEAKPVAARARELARAVGAHAEALADIVLAVSAYQAGSVDPTTPDLSKATSHLVAQTDRFSASPQLALLTATSQLGQGKSAEALRWADWLEECARSVGDMVLSIVPGAVRAMTALLEGRFDTAIAEAQASVDRATVCGNQTLMAQTLGLLASACAARGLAGRGFAAGASLFALSDEASPASRVEALVALATLELQRGRPSSAFAWLRAAGEELAADEDALVLPKDFSVSMQWAVTFVELAVVTRGGDDLAAVGQWLEGVPLDGSVQPMQSWWIRGMIAADATQAAHCFELASAASIASPFVSARIDLSWGVRLADDGQVEEAYRRLERSRAQFRSLGADGWERVAIRELEALPTSRGSDSNAASPVSVAAMEDPSPILEAPEMFDAATEPRWEITLLGSFGVRYEGRQVSLPLSLAAQALKIVTLRRRISVDELVELLWPEAYPGVGNRRLRNVLWRNRASCGDLLYRDGNFICLANDAVVDADRFRTAAEEAIVERDPARSSDLAREALTLYPGELLPGDHYVDWPTATRESLARLFVALLDRLVVRAIAEDQIHEALGYLDRLIDADPYEEPHYLKAAELHAGLGNVNRALSVLTRAERNLSELGMAPSSELRRVRAELDRFRRPAG